MKHYGLIGHSLSHSFSKKYFQEKFLLENIDADYQNFEIKDCDTVRKIIKENDLNGLHVTIPFKERIIRYLDEVSTEALKIGAVNAIQIKDNKLFGFNTDCIGFEKSLLENVSLKNKQALIFGSGGASKAVAYVLARNNVNYKFVSRNEIKDGFTYADLDENIFNKYLLLINTTPIGMFPNIEQELPIPYKFVKNEHFAFDLIYNPEKTRFLTHCEAEGASIKNGMDMLIYQAEASYKIFTY
jgi:shikimate dehydrogenase